MSEIIERYFQDFHRHVDDLAASQMQALEAGVKLCADALANKKVIHIYDTGHLVSHEFNTRTGGLVAYTPLTFDGVVDDNNLWRAQNPPSLSESTALSSEQALLKWVFSRGALQDGDVLIIGTVSGISLRPIELAIQARRHNLGVIGITSVDFSRALTSKHPTRKRLYEVCDVVLDNRSAYGDASFEIEGFDRPVCPYSGLSAAVLLWAMTAGIVQELVSRGISPSVYRSVNLPGGPEDVAAVQKQYRERGQ